MYDCQHSIAHANCILVIRPLYVDTEAVAHIPLPALSASHLHVSRAFHHLNWVDQRERTSCRSDAVICIRNANRQDQCGEKETKVKYVAGLP